MSTTVPTSDPQVGKLVSVVPVGLKEAALDSPTFRATTVHFADQVEFIEKWLDGYAKSASRLLGELSSFDQAMNSLLAFSSNPLHISEAILDHDYTLLAIRRQGECMKGLWESCISTVRKIDHMVTEPIRAFIQNDLRTFKEIRRTVEQTQKHYDHLEARYAGQTKSKEPSSLREDAFQLHEARKAYLKASMDFSVQAPQLRHALDKLLVKISFDQWREARIIHDQNVTTFTKWGFEMDRIKGWVHEMENSERYSLKELVSTRKRIEEAAELAARPSRELDDYSVSTVPYLGSHPSSAVRSTSDKPFRPEKQGWLHLRTLTGKPTRTIWVRRWAFLKNGIFGCLVQGVRTGGVEESERIGVLLCSIRAAFQEERRFCFEVKTKKHTILLQAESQKELIEWIGAFEAAKQKALENPASTETAISGKLTVQDPAFSISQPPAPEFTADPADSLTLHSSDDSASGAERNGGLSVPDREPAALRSSGDLGSRRPSGMDGEGSIGRDHASRIIQKLDIHRKSSSPQSPTQTPAGGIASLISASHNLLPYSGAMPVNPGDDNGNRGRSLSATSAREVQASTLAPMTLANPPAPTNMSKAAVFVSHERGIGVGLADTTGGMPSGMMANLWGSSNWGHINTLERELGRRRDRPNEEEETGTKSQTPQKDDLSQFPASGTETSDPLTDRQPKNGARHRQTISLDGGDASKIQRQIVTFSHEYPPYYPQQLKIQDAQFRLLFPNVKREESLVLVFRATWNPNEQQEFPGRAFVTTRNIYFYSHHLGLILTTSISLRTVMEVTAATGRDCDFLFLHIFPSPGEEAPTRVTVKTFLEPLRLLQRRLDYLVKDALADEPSDLATIFRAMNKMETEAVTRSPSTDSWEDVSLDTPMDGKNGGIFKRQSSKDLRAPIYVDKDFIIDHVQSERRKGSSKFKLPSQPVNYVPQGNLNLAAEKIFDVSPKALFHVLFGDKSALWQLLLHERMAQGIKQGPWKTLDSGHMRRDFEYTIEKSDLLGRSSKTKVSDYQIIDVLNDHLCYVVTDKRTPWHLPFRRNFRLVSKVVITYVSKSKSKLAIYTNVEWLWSPYVLKRVINKQASNDLQQDALDLVDLVNDQVRKLGLQSRTKKAITIFGLVGQQTNAFQFAAGDLPSNLNMRKARKQRTLTWLLLESLGSLLQSVVSSLMLWAFDVLRWVWKTFSANGVILALLVFSLLLNSFYSSRDTYDWWHERNAARFMTRLGVGPDHVMSKAIFLRDIDEAVANLTDWHTGQSSPCFVTFNEYSQGPGTLNAGSAVLQSVDTSSNRRLQRTRERLGTHRHDLLVALRVINSIEKEVLESEWEHWVRQEISRCQKIEVLLSDNDRVGELNLSLQQSQNAFGDRREDVLRWYEEYCSSCRKEQETLKHRSI